MRIVLLVSIILQAIALGMSLAENIGKEKTENHQIYRMVLGFDLHDIWLR
jgi:hypothetical protein